jgi:hypothetical protein
VRPGTREVCRSGQSDPPRLLTLTLVRSCGIPTDIDIRSPEFGSSRPLRVGGAIVGPGTSFTIRAMVSPAEHELVAGWAFDGDVVMVMAGRHQRSSWMVVATTTAG